MSEDFFLRKISFLSKKNTFLSECIYRKIELSSDNPLENFREQVKKSDAMSDHDKKSYNFPQISF